MQEELNLPRGPIRERVDTPTQEAGKTFKRLVSAAQEAFEDTAFVTGKEVTQKDVERVKAFYRKAAVVDPWVFNQSTQETLFLVARYSRMIGQKLNESGKFDLNLDELEALGLLHDIGRTFSHRRYRNDQIGAWILKKAGFTERFLELIPPEEHWLPVIKNGEIDSEATRIKYSDISEDQNLPARAVVTIADIIGKIENGKIITWEAFKETTRKRLHHPQRETSGPKEFQRMKSVTDNIDSVLGFYESLGTWLEEEMSTNLEDVVVQMQKDLESNPLEKTFNQENEQYQFNTAVFDLGGVILHGGSASDNSSLATAVAQAYALEKHTSEIAAAMDECVKKNQIGISSAQTQENLISRLGQPKNILSVKQIYVNDAQELTPDPNMIRLIKYFQNEGIKVIFASNIVQDEWEIVEEKFKDTGLNIQLVNGSITNQVSFSEIEAQGKLPVFTSFSTKVRKGKDSQRSDDKTFFEVIKDIANLDPNKTLVIDDKAQYCAEAENSGFKPYQFSTVAKFTDDIINLESNRK